MLRCISNVKSRFSRSPFTIAITLSIRTGKFSGSGEKLTFPFSIRLRSSTLFNNNSRCSELIFTFCRLSWISDTFVWFSAMSVNPIIAFIGDRISCDILSKKDDFALFAVSAFSAASRNKSVCSISSSLFLL